MDVSVLLYTGVLSQCVKRYHDFVRQSVARLYMCGCCDHCVRLFPCREYRRLQREVDSLRKEVLRSLPRLLYCQSMCLPLGKTLHTELSSLKHTVSVYKPNMDAVQLHDLIAVLGGFEDFRPRTNWLFSMLTCALHYGRQAVHVGCGFSTALGIDCRIHDARRLVTEVQRF